MEKKLKILHLEDLESDARLIGNELVKGGLDFERLVVDTREKFIAALRDFSPDIVLSDHSLPSFNSHEALAIFHKTGLKIPFILITSAMSDEFAVDIIHRGADDYVLKDRLIRLPTAIRNILEKYDLEKERQKFMDDLIERNKDLEQFSYIVSHNLRAPVAHILGLANVLKENILSDKEKNQTETFLVFAAQQLDDVIKDLNRILQVQRDTNVKKEDVSFTELVQHIKSSISSLIEKEKVNITTDFAAIDNYHTMKGHLYSVFYNLISNSIKFAQPGISPEINISSEIKGDTILLKFRDNGIGIDLSQHKNNLFGLYKRFHPEVEGKGMGLYMVKSQLGRLGGKISIRSELNKGTEFTIELEPAS